MLMLRRWLLCAAAAPLAGAGSAAARGDPTPGTSPRPCAGPMGIPTGVRINNMSRLIILTPAAPSKRNNFRKVVELVHGPGETVQTIDLLIR